jgi:hypothetical protein
MAAYFSRARSLYFITLGEALRRIRPVLFADLMIEQEWTEEPRRLAEILNAIDELTTKVWYNRHKNLEWRVERGQHNLVTREEWNRSGDDSRDMDKLTLSIRSGRVRSRRQREQNASSGKDNYGPWDDFEWGMINGKLSALRGVPGDEWDMLDT